MDIKIDLSRTGNFNIKIQSERKIFKQTTKSERKIFKQTTIRENFENRPKSSWKLKQKIQSEKQNLTKKILHENFENRPKSSYIVKQNRNEAENLKLKILRNFMLLPNH